MSASALSSLRISGSSGVLLRRDCLNVFPLYIPYARLQVFFIEAEKFLGFRLAVTTAWFRPYVYTRWHATCNACAFLIYTPTIRRATPHHQPHTTPRPLTWCRIAPIAHHLGAFVRFVCACDSWPPYLCFCECNNTIALNLKINGIQKGYSPNTHKTKPTSQAPNTNPPKPFPINRIPNKPHSQ